MADEGEDGGEEGMRTANPSRAKGQKYSRPPWRGPMDYPSKKFNCHCYHALGCCVGGYWTNSCARSVCWSTGKRPCGFSHGCGRPAGGCCHLIDDEKYCTSRYKNYNKIYRSYLYPEESSAASKDTPKSKKPSSKGSSRQTSRGSSAKGKSKGGAKGKEGRKPKMGANSQAAANGRFITMAEACMKLRCKKLRRGVPCSVPSWRSCYNTISSAKIPNVRHCYEYYRCPASRCHTPHC